MTLVWKCAATTGTVTQAQLSAYCISPGMIHITDNYYVDETVHYHRQCHENTVIEWRYVRSLTTMHCPRISYYSLSKTVRTIIIIMFRHHYRLMHNSINSTIQFSERKKYECDITIIQRQYQLRMQMEQWQKLIADIKPVPAADGYSTRK